MSSQSKVVGILDALAHYVWPLLVLIFVVIYRDFIRALLHAALVRVRQGDELTIGVLTLGKSVGPLQTPTAEGAVTDDHLALVHRCWRASDRDGMFGKRRMYQIHVIVFGTSEALDRVDHVIYRLDSAYPNPVQASGNRSMNFELKELANGYSLIRAEVKVKGQAAPVLLSRFIDISEKSEPLREKYLPRKSV